MSACPRTSTATRFVRPHAYRHAQARADARVNPRRVLRCTDVHLAVCLQTLALFVHQLVVWAEEQNATMASVLHGRIDLTAGAMLVGHSRGAKANSLLACACSQRGLPRQGRVVSSRRAGAGGSSVVDDVHGRGSRRGGAGAGRNATVQRLACRHVVRAVVNLDPVDGSAFDADPSVLPLLPNASARFLHIGECVCVSVHLHGLVSVSALFPHSVSLPRPIRASARSLHIDECVCLRGCVSACLGLCVGSCLTLFRASARFLRLGET